MVGKKKRLYIVKSHTDSEYGECVCAYSCKEAKQIAWDSSDFLQEEASDDEGWIGVRVNWLKKAYVKGLKLGCIQPDADSLRRDTFSYLEEAECPICMNIRYLIVNEYEDDNFRFVGCSDCAEKYETDKLKKEDIPEEAIPYIDLEKIK